MNKFPILIKNNSLRVALIKYRLPIFMIVLIIIKQMMLMSFPIFAYSTAIHDDRLMMDITDSLLKGEWLGAYSEKTLIKGIFFPLFLAANRLLGVPYSISITSFYSLACVVFVLGIKDYLKKDIPLMILFVVLIFNPISFSAETYLRVYRNCLIAAQVLIIVGCMFAVYLKREKSNYVILRWAIGAGLGLASLWHTREDGIWIMPLIVVVMMVTTGMIIGMKKTTYLEKLKKSAIVITPLVILFLSGWLISGVNYLNYGLFSANELNDSNFKGAIKSMYAVETTEEVHNVSVPRSTLRELYEISPTLNSIRSELETSLERWSSYDKKASDRQVEDGWFIWCFRDAVAMGGYYENAQMANAFYEKIDSEIQLAFETGKLTQRKTMPSTYMSPWRDIYWSELPVAFLKTVTYIGTYEEQEISVLTSIDDGQNGIRLFEKMTNELAIYPGETIGKSEQLKANALHAVIRIYQIMGIPVFLVSMFIYIGITGLLMIKKIRKQYSLLDTWLILSGLIASITVLSMGVAYTEISAYDAISYWYLAGAYPLLSIFIVMTLDKGLEIGKDLHVFGKK